MPAVRRVLPPRYTSGYRVDSPPSPVARFSRLVARPGPRPWPGRRCCRPGEKARKRAWSQASRLVPEPGIVRIVQTPHPRRTGEKSPLGARNPGDCASAARRADKEEVCSGRGMPGPGTARLAGDGPARRGPPGSPLVRPATCRSGDRSRSGGGPPPSPIQCGKCLSCPVHRSCFR